MRNHLRLLCTWLVVLFVAACTPIGGASTASNPVSAQPAATATRIRTTATPRSRTTATVTATPAIAATRAATNTLKVYFLDVGQGDSILLKGPDFTILVDAGQHDEKDVVPYLEEIGIESIDLLVGTHPHADHIGQFPEVLEAFPVSEVWMSGDTNTTRTFEDAIDAIDASGAGYHEPRAGEVFQLGSARIEVLNPTHLTGEPNEGSVVFRLIFGKVAFLFTGDAEAPTEREILASGRDLHAQILKLGHHGSNTSSSLAFLLAVEPELAIWSAGFENSYGHPHDVTLERLAHLGVPVVGTLGNGTILLVTDGTTYQIEDFDPTDEIAVPSLTPVAGSSSCEPGQVNINTASFEELMQITQVGQARAREIIELRPFSSVDDLEQVSGIGAGTLASIKAQGLACVDTE